MTPPSSHPYVYTHPQRTHIHTPRKHHTREVKSMRAQIT